MSKRQVPVNRPWAKLSEPDEPAKWHSLVAHSSDVAAVLRELLEIPGIRRRLAIAAGVEDLDETDIQRLCFLAFIHDIGKVNAGFQARSDTTERMVGHINELYDLLTGNGSVSDQAKETIRLYEIVDWFGDQDTSFLESAFAHHGSPWHAARSSEGLWRGAPLALMSDHVGLAMTMFPLAFGASAKVFSERAVHVFAGLMMLADWIGSDTSRFPMSDGLDDATRYASSRNIAKTFLEASGMQPERWRRRFAEASFSDISGYAAPSDLQSWTRLAPGQLVITESETGSGKTEAALWRFAELFGSGQVDGLYFALPTRVAATGIFTRTVEAMKRLFPAGDGPTPVLAVPGQLSAGDAVGTFISKFGILWNDGEIRDDRWAAERPKRFLTAPVAIGTIDQVLLGTIKTRHAHMRAAALSRSLLVVDEVHSSDIYMRGLLRMALTNHLAAGGHALLLSATLSNDFRSEILGLDDKVDTAAYPLVSWTGTSAGSSAPKAGMRSKTVTIDMRGLIGDPAAVAAIAADAARKGAKVLVIRNTVKDAIAVFEHLDAMEGVPLFSLNGIRTLHHGRFSAEDRKHLDAAVNAAMGKGSPRTGMVIVGTQTLEQSLDIDADLLISDICPIDVLLQRIGRLFRHDNHRPAGFETATAIVLVPENMDFNPFAIKQGHGIGTGDKGGVYENALISRATAAQAFRTPVWVIPQMNRDLVEGVLSDAAMAKAYDEVSHLEAWRSHVRKVTGMWQSKSLSSGSAVISHDTPFNELKYPKDGERYSSRLGDSDVQLDFPPGITGPFGYPLSTLKIPFHMGRGVVQPPTGIETSKDFSTTEFSCGAQRFRYSRLGLEKLSLTFS